MEIDLLLMQDGQYKGHYILYITFVVLLLYGAAQSCYAAAFSMKPQNVTNLGYAYAGTAALAEDASSGYYNPAALTKINDQLLLSAVGMRTKTKLEAFFARDNGALNVEADNITNPQGRILIPASHFAKRISDNWVTAINITSPFAVKLTYDGDSIAQYMATKSLIKTINFSPSLGYQLSNNIALGLGIDFLKTHIILNTNCRMNSQGYINNDGKGWGYSYHLGLLYRFSSDTRIGLAYHGNYNVHVRGQTEAEYVSVPNPESFDLGIKLPDAITYSVHYAYDHKWSIMSDIEFMHWSRFKYLRFEFNTNSYIEEQKNFHNSFRLALGVNYQYYNNLSFKLGIAFDQSPVKAVHRTARMPDSDRIWLALGIKYRLFNCLHLDIGYAHIMLKNAVIEATSPDNPLKGTTFSMQKLDGIYRRHMDVMGMQIRYDFG